MPDKPPTVSVIIAVLNCADTIERAVESALAQTWTDYEIIVVDGGSTDGTLEKLRPYGGRIRLMAQTGKGVSNARNEGIKASRGEYIAILDADDEWLPEKLKVQMAYLQDHPETDMVFSDVYWYDVNGEFKGRVYKAPGVDFSTGRVFDRIFEDNFISTGTTLIKRGCFEEAGFFDETIFYAEDTELWLRMAYIFRIGYLAEPLIKYRLRPASRILEFEKHYQAKIRFLEEFVDVHSDYFKNRRRVKNLGLGKTYFNFAYRYFESRRPRPARRYFLKSLRYLPLRPRAWIYFLASNFPPPLLEFIRKAKNKSVFAF